MEGPGDPLVLPSTARAAVDARFTAGFAHRWTPRLRTSCERKLDSPCRLRRNYGFDASRSALSFAACAGSCPLARTPRGSSHAQGGRAGVARDGDPACATVSVPAGWQVRPVWI